MQPSQNQGVGRGVAQIDNELKLELTTERYPVSGRILISQRLFGLSRNSATAFFALGAVTSQGSSTYDVLEPALGGKVENRQAPLRERNHPLPMKVCDDGRHRQPLPCQMPQRVGEYLEPGLMRWGQYPQFHFSGLSRSTLFVNAGSRLPKLRR